MAQNDNPVDNLVESTRRAFLKAAGATGIVAKVGTVAGAESDSADRTDESDDTDSQQDDTGIKDDYVYNWKAATLDAYWYSLYNLLESLMLSGNGVLIPEVAPDQFQQRMQQMMETAGLEEPPMQNPNPALALFTTGDPHYTAEPQHLPKPDGDTLQWNRSGSSGVVSPASVAWPQLKAVTWAKNFENHFAAHPNTPLQQFRTMLLGTQAQMGIRFALIDGKLRKNDDDMLLVTHFDPEEGAVVDETARPNQHAAMLWFLSNMVTLAKGGWYGYENPEPLLPADRIQTLTDQLAQTVMDEFPAETIHEQRTTRDVGLMLGAAGWYGTHAGNDDLAGEAADYAHALAGIIEGHLEDNGKVTHGTENQAATQGAVGQGLLWASQIDGVDYETQARSVLSYLHEDLWDEDAGTFSNGCNSTTYRISAQDAGDITGGLNAADAVLGIDGVQEQFTAYVENTFNRGRLMRSQLRESYYPNRKYVVPLPPEAGGEFGQAPVYNTAVEYDAEDDEWQVTDEKFTAGAAIYLANQDVWFGNWSGGFYRGRGIPGQTDEPRNG